MLLFLHQERWQDTSWRQTTELHTPSVHRAPGLEQMVLGETCIGVMLSGLSRNPAPRTQPRDISSGGARQNKTPILRTVGGEPCICPTSPDHPSQRNRANVHEKPSKRSGGVSTHPAWALPCGLVAEPKRKVENREEPPLHRGLYSPRGNQVPPGMRFLNNAILHRVSPKSWQPERQNTFETSN